MAHQRIVKPEFFTDVDMGELAPLARLFYVGLWTQADRKGVLEDKPRQLKARIMPYDDVDADAVITELTGRGKLIRYRVGDKKLLAIRSWKENQSVHANEKDSELPPPSKATEITRPSTADGQLPEQNGQLTVSDGKLSAFPVPVPVPVPVPSPGPGPAPFAALPGASRRPRNRIPVTDVKPPDTPREGWRFREWEQWAQHARQSAGLVPEDPVPIPEEDEFWTAVTAWTAGAIQPICDAFIAFGEDKHWKAARPPLPIRAFLAQWKKYMPLKEPANAHG